MPSSVKRLKVTPRWVQNRLVFLPTVGGELHLPRTLGGGSCQQYQRELLEGAVQNPGTQSLGSDFCNIYPGADCHLCFAFITLKRVGYGGRGKLPWQSSG